MKINVLSIALIGAAVLAASCNKKTEEAAQPAVQEVAETPAVAEPIADSVAKPATLPGTEHRDNDVIEVTGKVTEIIQGKDGYMAKLTTADEKKYTATISIPNLDNPKQYRAVKIGDNITVKGVVTNLESDVLIRVKELK